jgi:hypothetical protein
MCLVTPITGKYPTMRKAWFPRERGAPRREPENSSGYVRREEYEGERDQRGRGKSVSLPMSLKLDLLREK